VTAAGAVREAESHRPVWVAFAPYLIGGRSGPDALNSRTLEFDGGGAAANLFTAEADEQRSVVLNVKELLGSSATPVECHSLPFRHNPCHL
jgi:hypothetical protein